jgi:hypothetical protein
MHSRSTNVRGGTDGRNAGKRPQRNFSARLVVSVVLHALGLSGLIVGLGLAANPVDIPLIVPVNIVQLANETVGPKAPDQASIPQQKAAAPSSPRMAGESFARLRGLRIVALRPL